MRTTHTRIREDLLILGIESIKKTTVMSYMAGLKTLALLIVAVMFILGSVGIAVYMPTIGFAEWWQIGIAICGLWLGYVVLVYYVEES